MGNRCVITTKENFESNGVGVYLHWNGGRDSVEAFLKYCEMKGYREPEFDNYGWARLVQVTANFFGGSLDVGIDTIDNLDCRNGDNGVYIIQGWKIVDRKYFYSMYEQQEYPLDEMLLAIDERMPIKEQFGETYLKGEIVKPEQMKVGDIVAFLDWKNEVIVERIIGIGADEYCNGHHVLGVPYVGRYGDEPVKNPNNYLFDDREYRLIR